MIAGPGLRSLRSKKASEGRMSIPGMPVMVLTVEGVGKEA